MMRAFLIALQFLTCLPVKVAGELDEKALGRSVLYYPLVGLLVGLLLVALAWVLGDEVPPMLKAAVLLTVWVAVTGALHLDGLADSADAWVGGLGDRERTLAIMKDPASGPMGVAAVVLVLLVKFAALHALVETNDWMALVLVPLLGRTVLPLLFLTTPYVRPGGLGAGLAAHAPKRAAALMVLATGTAIAVLGGLTGLVLLLAGAGVFFIVRQAMVRRLGGSTGDTAGALVELTEVMALAAAIVIAA